MDLWTLRVKSTHRSPFLLRNSILEKPSSWNSRKMRAEDARVFEIRVSRRNVSGYHSLVARARGKKNPENSDFSSSFGTNSSAFHG